MSPAILKVAKAMALAFDVALLSVGSHVQVTPFECIGSSGGWGGTGEVVRINQAADGSMGTRRHTS